MEDKTDTIALAAEITAAWLSNANNRIDADTVPAFLSDVHATLNRLGGDAADAVVDAGRGDTDYTPATTARKSLANPDFIISMIDGKPYRTLRRHLTTHGLTPDDYRARYNLKPDYPMVAPSYSETRRAMAKKIGLGRKSAGRPPLAAEPAKARTKLKVSTPA